MAEQVPAEVWTLVCQHLGQADRLRCALVSQRVAAAARAATVEVLVSRPRGLGWGVQQHDERVQAALTYLQHHGQHVTGLVMRLSAAATSQPVAVLPCGSLVELELDGAAVQLGANKGLPGVLASCCSCLTRLKLSDCTFASGGGGLAKLSVLVHLADLHVSSIKLQAGGCATLPGSFWPRMKHSLTHLSLSHLAWIEAIHRVSCLTNLRVLSIASSPGARLVGEGFVLPKQLQELRLGESVIVDPAVLQSAAQLTLLDIEMAFLLSHPGMSSGAVLLAAVAQLPSLASLTLTNLQDTEWQLPDYEAFSGLVASDKLHTLCVRNCGLDAEAWAYVFVRSLPALRSFCYAECVDPVREVCLDSWTLRHLATYCPNLESLEVPCRDYNVMRLLPLSKLTSLELVVDYVADEDGLAGALQSVAEHLTSLRSLQLFVSGQDDVFEPYATSAGLSRLLPLTGLQQLTSLGVWGAVGPWGEVYCKNEVSKAVAS